MKKITLLFFLCLQLLVQAQLDWEVFEFDTTYQFEAIHMLTDQEIYVGGMNGAFFKTVNQGESWSPISTPIQQNIIDLLVTPKNEIWIIMQRDGLEYTNTLYRSADGGSNWVMENLICPPTCLTITEKYVFVGQSTICFSQFTLHRFSLEDGTKTPIILRSSFNQINALSFVNDSVGYAIGDRGFFARTIDRGDHWEIMVYGDGSANLRDLHTPNDTTIFMAALDSSGRSQFPAVILSSRDAGQSWKDELGMLFVTPTFHAINGWGADSVMAVGQILLGNERPYLETNMFSPNGAFWQRDEFIWSQNGQQLNDIDVGKNCLFVVGDKGLVLCSCPKDDKTTSTVRLLEKISDEFSIYPNPTHDRLNFTWEKELDKPLRKWEVWSPNGGMLLNGEEFQGRSVSIDVQDLSKGLYCLIIEDLHGIVHRSIFIKS